MDLSTLCNLQNTLALSDSENDRAVTCRILKLRGRSIFEYEEPIHHLVSREEGGDVS
jgi:hypothetical protein